MLEGYGDRAVGVLDIEDDSVTANFTPMADDAKSVFAAGHDAGQINGAYLEVFADRDSLLGDRGRQDSGDDDVLVGLKYIAGAFAVRVTYSLSQFRRR